MYGIFFACKVMWDSILPSVSVHCQPIILCQNGDRLRLDR